MQLQSEKKTQLTKKSAVVGLCCNMCKSSKYAAAQELLIKVEGRGIVCIQSRGTRVTLLKYDVAVNILRKEGNE